METTHVLSEPISRLSLSQFLVNFTEGKLERFQRSQATPLFTPSTTPPSVSVSELNTDTYMPVTFNDSMVSHVYLTLYYLKSSSCCIILSLLGGKEGGGCPCSCFGNVVCHPMFNYLNDSKQIPTHLIYTKFNVFDIRQLFF